jgi:hypothetical protein
LTFDLGGALDDNAPVPDHQKGWKFTMTVSLIALCASLSLAGDEARDDAKKGPALAHTVFFQLKDASPAAREKLVEACRKYLSKHDGQSDFTVGIRGAEFAREVNDAEFDVAIHMVFKSKEAQDVYQKHERHLKFIAECQDNWKKVRVFDWYLSPKKDKDEEGEVKPAKADIPDAAEGFAGMLKGKVVSSAKGKIVLSVEAVPEVWKHSKASDPKSLIGKAVRLEGARKEGEEAGRVSRYLAGLKAGDEVTLDVAHLKGETLTVVELTEGQRAKAGKAEAKRDGDR